MAETAEGFSVSATLTLDLDDASQSLGEIGLLPKLATSELDYEPLTTIVLDMADEAGYSGDILRSNTGGEGFSVKTRILLDSSEAGEYVGDILHGKVINTEEEEEIAASVLLGLASEEGYLADISRSNSGSEGFTIKAAIALDDPGSSSFIADIRHGKVRNSEKGMDLGASLVLDEGDGGLETCIGDILRSNSGNGITLRGFVSLDDYERDKIIGDLFRGNKTKSDYHTTVFVWNGKKYLIVYDGSLYRYMEE